MAIKMRGKAPASKAKVSNKKANERLASVIQETAAPSAVELLRKNEAFTLPEDKGWLVLLLSVEKIGGLSVKEKSVEAKGSLLQLISNDTIPTVATEDMLADECFGIIPTTTALDRMSEFSMLDDYTDEEAEEHKTSKYTWAVVTQEGDELAVRDIAYAKASDARLVDAGEMTLEKAVGKDAWGALYEGSEATSQESVSQEGDVAEPATEAVAVVPGGVPDAGDALFTEEALEGGEVAAPQQATEEVDPFVDEDPFADEGFIDNGDLPFTDDGEVLVHDPDAPMLDEADGSFDEDEEDAEGESDVEDLDPEYVAQVEQVTSSELVEGVARRFLSSDLGLEVELDEFNKIFNIGSQPVQIETPVGASEWLGDQVAQLSREANAALGLMRQQNHDRLRTDYVRLLSLHAEAVTKSVSLEQPNRYQSIHMAIQQANDERLGEKDETVRAAQKEIAERYQAEAKAAGEQARITAEQQYRDRNAMRMQREQHLALTDFESSLEALHSKEMDELLAIRRREAQGKFEAGMTRIIGVLQDVQAEQRELEQEVLNNWVNIINEVIANHREDDISRVRVLDKDQANFDAVEHLKGVHATAMAALQTEFEDRLSRAREELKHSDELAKERAKAQDAEWQRILDKERVRGEQAVGEATKLTERLAQLDEAWQAKADAQTEQAVRTLEDANRLITTERDNSIKTQATTNKVLTIMMVALTVAGVLSGLLIGAFWF